MAVLEGGVSGELLGVGAQAASPLHATLMHLPYGSGGVFRLGTTTGTIAAALAANSELFQFRYVTATSRVCLVHRVTVSAALNAAATAAGLSSLRMCMARSWTADGTGGTALTLSGDNCQLRTSMATTEVTSARIATTAALGVGTKTLDATDLVSVIMGVGTGALTVGFNTTLVPDTQLFGSQDGSGHPLVLAHQEGFVIRSGLIMPATMTWGLSVNVVWSEVSSY